MEILFANPALGQLIRDGKTHQVPGFIQLGRKHGMREMDEALLTLLKDDTVSVEEAYPRAVDKKEFRKRLAKDLGISLPGEADDEILAQLGIEAS